MKSAPKRFLTHVLGREGAAALARTAERDSALASLLVPRAAISWLELQDEYEGEIPGLDNSYLKFSKSETGYTGLVTLPEVSYEFVEVSPAHVAAALAVAVGVDAADCHKVRDVTLVRLGKSIDVLAKSTKFARELDKKALKIEESSSEESSSEEEPLDKGKAGGGAEQAGPPADQRKPQGPIGQLTPTATAPATNAKTPKVTGIKLPKPSLKPPPLKLSEEEAHADCEACGGRQFLAKRFIGCLCFRDLAKSVTAVSYGDGYVLEFKPGTSREVVVALRKAFVHD